ERRERAGAGRWPGRHRVRRPARVDGGPRRRAPRQLHAARAGTLRGARARAARRRRARGHHVGRGRAARRRVLRRADARAAAAPHRGRDRRPVLHAGRPRHAARGHPLHGARHHRAGAEGPVGHADRLPAARRAGRGGVDVPAAAGADMRRVLSTALWLAAAVGASPVAAQTDHVLVISGVSGEPRFAEAFHKWALSFMDALTDRHGVPAANIAYLAERPARDAARIHGRSDRAGIEAAFQRLAQRAAPEDRVLVVLFGHGSEQDGEPRLNIPGPDLTASDFARLLGTLRAREVALVHTGSASGGWIGKLSAPGRVVLTATRSGFEQNETIFPEHFVAAYAGDGADTDKDGRVSL